MMEKQIKYVQLSADNAENCKVFESLMYEYIDEMNEHSERPLPGKSFSRNGSTVSLPCKDRQIAI